VSNHISNTLAESLSQIGRWAHIFNFFLLFESAIKHSL